MAQDHIKTTRDHLRRAAILMPASFPGAEKPAGKAALAQKGDAAPIAVKEENDKKQPQASAATIKRAAIVETKPKKNRNKNTKK